MKERKPGMAELSNRSRAQNVLGTVLLELTYRCNLDCTFCYNDLGLRGTRITLEKYRSLIDELAEMNVLRLTLSGGEPLMYPHFFELGAYARSRGFMITVKSNVVPLNQRNAERLKKEVDPFNVETSLHGSCAETHDRQTQVPGSFDKLLKNIKILQSVGVRVQLNAPMTRWNEHEVGPMYQLADQLGVRLKISSEVSPRDNGDTSPLEISPSRKGIKNLFLHNLARAESNREAARLRIDKPVYPAKGGDPFDASKETSDAPQAKICASGSTYMAIDPFGNVYPCVQYRRKAGNIHDSPVRQIWENSETLQDVRNLAVKAVKTAEQAGIGHYCMGLAAIHSGDPLIPHERALERDRIYQRLTWGQEQSAEKP